MRIYIDFDDVLCETARYLVGVARKLFGARVDYEAIAGFDLQHSFALSATQIGELMHYAHREEVLKAYQPTPGGLAALSTLEQRGCELTIVTGRPAASHPGSRAWLQQYDFEHLPIIYLDKYGRQFASQSGLLATYDTPPTLDRAAFDKLTFDVAIDDSPTALDLLAERTECRILVFDRPWNRDYAIRPNMTRVKTWDEILGQLFCVGT